jgi:hypothetical protein
MQAFFLIMKFFGCLGYYLFWGRSGLSAASKISLFVVWFLSFFFSLSEKTRLTFGKEAGTPMLSWETETWIKVGIGILVFLVAFGAACVRVKSFIFKAGDELEFNLADGIFRLSVERRGWLVDVEVPSAKVQRVIDANGNSAFPATPFELIWMHQPKLGERPKMSGRGLVKIDVFKVVGRFLVSPDRAMRLPQPSELHFCGINGNSLRVDQLISLSKVGGLWVEISVAEFTRWFLVESVTAPPLFRVTAGFPPLSSGIRQSSFGSEATVIASFLLVPSLIGLFVTGFSGFIAGGFLGIFLVLFWFANGRTFNSKPSAG